MKLLLILFFLCGCFPLTNVSINKLQYKQSMKDVVKIMGNPTERKVYYTKDYFVYYIHRDIYDLFINTSKFPYIGFYPFMRTGKEFWVIFENNELVSFGNKENYKNDLPQAIKY